MKSSPRLLALLGFFLALLGAAAPAAAQGQFDRPKYASIVVDANSGEVLYALRADDPRYPASITKVMTLYLTFEALATGRLSLTDRVPFSAHAAAQMPSKIGVPAGGDLSVDEAIQAAAVMSANDAATALAEKLGSGSEARFAALMTLRAQELGMKRTRFLNANGLPDAARRVDVNVSTARDIAVLSRAVMRDYPQYYRYFNQRSFTWRGRTTLNHNRLLLSMAGMDGLKTGYTNAAGFNLAASAVRDGRRLITVVLGGSSTAARNENVETLLTAGFQVLDRRSRGDRLTLASMLSAPDDASGLLVRPAYEMGSGEQDGLKVVLGQPVPNPPAPPLPVPAPVRLARADLPPPVARFAPPPARVAPSREAQACDTVTVRRHGRRVKERRCEPAASAGTQVAAVAAPDCRRLSGRRLQACRAEARDVRAAAVQVAAAAPDCRRLSGRKLKSCRAEAREVRAAVVEVAKAEAGADCNGLKGRKLTRCKREEKAEAKVAVTELRDCAKAGGRKARASCRADVATAAPAAKADAAGGGYQVQVGAFGSKAEAERALARIGKAHAVLFDSAAEHVEGAGKAYRARFAGLSKTEAQAACKRLASKGERCMVVR